MSDEYYLKIGGTEVFNEQVIADLSASEEEKKNKADAILSERLKEARVRIGTLLKTDNVSFLFGAGASMKAGGVGLAAILYEIEKALHEKAQASAEDQDTSWLSLFYETNLRDIRSAFQSGRAQTSFGWKSERNSQDPNQS